MTSLAVAHQAINLGQGFPEADGPQWLKEAAHRAVLQGPNQYAAGPGDLRLRSALAAKAQADHGLEYCPESEITVCHGATEALAALFLGLLNPGDEVILLEPVFDCYIPAILIAGGVPRFLTAIPPEFTIDFPALERLIGPKTRAILLNNPWNPCGRVFSLAELENFAALIRRHPQVLAVTDEVYEHIVYPPHRHLALAALPGMRERTCTVSSFSKSLSMTGWKVGYAMAPPGATQAIRAAHQFLTFCCTSPLQAAYAQALQDNPLANYYPLLLEEYQASRKLCLDMLSECGLNPLVPAGTYFVLTDVRTLGFPCDMDFCLRLPAQVGVAAFPASTLYGGQEGKGWVRWAFCKTEATLMEAAQRLKKLSQMKRD